MEQFLKNEISENKEKDNLKDEKEFEVVEEDTKSPNQEKEKADKKKKTKK